MKLVELLKELESKKEQLNHLRENSVLTNGLAIYGKTLRDFEDRLFECEEFSNVVRVNYLDLPSFLVEKETEEPISANRNFIGGDVKPQTAVEITIKPGDEIKLNKYVDIYSITLLKVFNHKEDINKPGIWVYPTVFDANTFEPTNQIRVIWDPEKLKDALKLMDSKETPKERLMRMFESALDSLEPNISCEYIMKVRCSSRSFAQDLLKADTPTIEDPMKQYVFSGTTGFVGFTGYNDHMK